MLVTSEYDETSDTRTYNVVGQVFFSSSEKFMESFDFKEATDNVVIDLSRAHFWDITAVAALDKAVVKFRREGAEVEVIGLNEASATIRGSLWRPRQTRCRRTVDGPLKELKL